MQNENIFVISLHYKFVTPMCTLNFALNLALTIILYNIWQLYNLLFYTTPDELSLHENMFPMYNLSVRSIKPKSSYPNFPFRLLNLLSHAIIGSFSFCLTCLVKSSTKHYTINKCLIIKLIICLLLKQCVWLRVEPTIGPSM